ncbi:histone-like nucleoid-structuring protein Lsr2 [Streptomyces sp. NPDC087437]|uniref:Lsr2 family DNA-binding protein n=1 Tax=Streptomyces sp. NPDC087437 TaxID=3365789 RepID=UPI0038019390
MAGEILVATVSAAVIWDGRTVTLTAGKTTVRAGHALLDGRAHMFAPLHVDFDVEDAGEPEEEPEGAMVQTMRASIVTDDTEPGPADTVQEPEPDPAPRPDAKTVRAWAGENGIDVPARGKIPDSVYEQYQAAQD